jgi:tRNA G18 (ribose-2'-O)-methylase SpoU
MALFPPIDAKPEDVRALLAPLRGDFTIALFGDNPFAVGAIIRTAHNFLAKEILLVGTGTHYEKASMGMEKYESIVTLPDASAFFARCGEKPIYAIEKDAATTAIADVESFPKDVVFAFGNEKDGLPADVLARATAVVGIPIYGVNHSLPVVVAAGIVMHEWARRHYRGVR